MFTKTVQCTSVHKASLLYKCTQNHFTEPVYKKTVYSASVHKTSKLYNYTHKNTVYYASVLNRTENVQGQNITKECTWKEHF